MRNDIQQLRGIAVISVLLYHANFVVLQNGFLGVDVFFVISGYVITKSILQKGSVFSLVQFYRRRALRILPVSIIVLTLSFITSYLFLQPNDFRTESLSIFASATFVSNFYNFFLNDYFAQDASLRPSIHYWSLSVEEQFYVIFPLLFITISKTQSSKFIRILLIIILTIISVICYLRGTPSESFYMPHMRAWQFMFGALVALIQQGKRSSGYSQFKHFNLIKLTILFGLICIIGEFPDIDIKHKTIIITIAATLFVFLKENDSRFKNQITSALSTLGDISFSLYLIHQPVFTFYTYYTNQVMTSTAIITLIPLTCLLAYVSFVTIELPFKKTNMRTSHAFITVFTPLAFISFVSLSVYVYDFSKSAGQLTSLYFKNANYNFDKTALRNESWSHLREMTQNKSYGIDRNQFDTSGWFTDKSQATNVLIVGNSHSKDVFNQFIHMRKIKPSFEIGRYGTQIKDIDTFFFESNVYQSADIIVFASRYTEQDLAKLSEILNLIKTSNKKIIVMSRIFEFPEFGPRNIMFADKLVSHNLTQSDIVHFVNNAYFEYYQANKNNLSLPSNKINFALKDLLDELSLDIYFYDRTADICNETKKSCSILQDDYTKNLYDYGHFTTEGANLMGSISSTQIIEMIEN